LLFFNILGEIVKAWKIENIDASIYVITISLSNVVGRLTLGFTLDTIGGKIPFIASMIPAAGLMVVAHCLMAFLNNSISLMLGSIATGISYGATSAILPYVTNNYFGDENFGQNMGWMFLSVGCFSFVFGVITGQIYDRQAVDGQKCFGRTCYMYTLLGTTILGILNIIVVLFLTKKRKTKETRSTECFK